MFTIFKIATIYFNHLPIRIIITFTKTQGTLTTSTSNMAQVEWMAVLDEPRRDRDMLKL